MTEIEWQKTTDVLAMLQFLAEHHRAERRKAGRRKLRLFGCACCRRLSGWMSDHRSREAVEVAERLADGRASEDEVRAAREGAREALRASGSIAARRAWSPGDETRGCDWPPASEWWAAQAAYCVLETQVGGAVYGIVGGSVTPGHHLYPDYQRMHRWQADVLRCLFGNLFRVVPVDSGWFIPKARALANGIYDDRAFDRLPVLGDALQEAGCDNADVLDHCRGAVPHGRGCWVVDLLLDQRRRPAPGTSQGGDVAPG